MATVSSLHSRRFANRITEATQPFISFRLRQEWFVLPLQAIQRVSSLNADHHNFDFSHLNITTVDHQHLKWIDTERQIFLGSVVGNDSAIVSTARQPHDFVILFKDNQGETRGLAIDSKPQLHRIPTSHFVPVPSSHHAHWLKCVSAMVLQTADTPDLFLLDLNGL